MQNTNGFSVIQHKVSADGLHHLGTGFYRRDVSCPSNTRGLNGDIASPTSQIEHPITLLQVSFQPVDLFPFVMFILQLLFKIVVQTMERNIKVNSIYRIPGQRGLRSRYAGVIATRVGDL